jgi:hypothetical protein
VPPLAEVWSQPVVEPTLPTKQAVRPTAAGPVRLMVTSLSGTSHCEPMMFQKISSSPAAPTPGFTTPLIRYAS